MLIGGFSLCFYSLILVTAPAIRSAFIESEQHQISFNQDEIATALLNLTTTTAQTSTYAIDDSLFIDETNWHYAFTEICYYHSTHVADPNAMCSLTDYEIERWRDERCTLMDVFLAARHYHPRVGRSKWSSKFASEKQNDERSMTIARVALHHHQSTNQSQVLISGVSNSNFTNLYNKVGHRLSSMLYRFQSIWSSLPRHQKLGIKGLITMALLLVIIIVVGLLRDFSTFRQSLQLAFSYRRHLKSIFTLPPQKPINQDDRFSFFDGLRVFSMLWVILGHSILYWATFLPFSQSSQMVFQMAKEKINYPLFAAVFAVDNFFYISGFLTGYQIRLFFNGKFSHGRDPKKIVNAAKTSSENRRAQRNECRDNSAKDATAKMGHHHNEQIIECAKGSKTSRSSSPMIKTMSLSIMMIVQRYVRLMSVHAFVLFGYLSLDWNTMKLPAGSRYLQSTNVACAEVAPSLLLLINNHIHGEFVNECLGSTWYLANDFQFFLVGLFVVIISLSFPNIAWFLIASLLMACLSSSFYISLKYQLGIVIDRFADIYFNVSDHLQPSHYFPLHPVMDYFYVKSYTRIAPHLIGLSIGLILAQCSISATTTITSTEEKARARKNEQLNDDKTDNVKTCPVTKDGKKTSSTLLNDFVTRSTRQRGQLSCNSSVIRNEDDQDSDINNENNNHSHPSPSQLIRRLPVLSSHSSNHQLPRSSSLPSITILCPSNEVRKCPQSNMHIINRRAQPFHDDADGLSSCRPNLPGHLPPSLEGSILVTPWHKTLSVSSVSTIDSPTQRRSKSPPFDNVILGSSSFIRRRCRKTCLEDRLSDGHSSDSISTITALSESESPAHRKISVVEQSSHPIEFLPPIIQSLLNSYWLLTTITFGIPLLLMIGGHIANHIWHWPVIIDASYMTLSRPLWGLSLAGFTLLMLYSQRPHHPHPHPHHSIINSIRSAVQSSIQCLASFLGHPYWSPMSKLSYTIYICHPFVLFGFYGNGFGSKTFLRGYMLVCYVINVSITVVAAILLSVLIEIPMKHIATGFFKVLSSPNRPSRQSQKVSSDPS